MVPDTIFPRTRQLALFFAAAALMAMAGTVMDTTFGNYLSHTYGIDAAQRGRLEFSREFPGFAVALVAGALMFLPEVRVGSVGALLTAVGLLGLGLWSPTYGLMMVWMVVNSTGTHLNMPTEGAIALGLADPGRRGRRLGQLGLAATSAALVCAVAIYFIRPHDPHGFRTTFTLGAGCAIASLILYSLMPHHIPHNAARRRLVFRRRYWLYYVLCAFFGARKQIFLTFGPWVIITVFLKEAQVFAVLYICGRGIAIWLRPLLGRLIDRIGPRPILLVEAVVIIAVCLGYVLALDIRAAHPLLAVALVYVCYVLDDVMFAAEMARSTYAARLAPSRDELAGTLAAGVSINHAISVIAPTFGGLLWVAQGGAQPVFLVAAGLMVVSGAFAFLVRPPASAETPPVPQSAPTEDD